jgi:hypothetical protein
MLGSSYRWSKRKTARAARRASGVVRLRAKDAMVDSRTDVTTHKHTLSPADPAATTTVRALKFPSTQGLHYSKVVYAHSRKYP